MGWNGNWQLSQSHSESATRFKTIDRHATAWTPFEATRSVKALAAHLRLAASTELEKVRVVYKWITAHIGFDVDGRYGRRAKLPNDAESVLKNRLCVCEGYANLMLELCVLLEISCKIIIGYSKEAVSNASGVQQAAFDANEFHAWNAVHLDGRWQLIDCTWGAGFVQCGKEFVRRETDFYFLTNPDVFIEDHFPFMNSDVSESEKWQLLEKPIELDTFHSRVQRQRAGIDHQVELVSHKQAVIDVDGEVTLKFRGSGRPLTAFSAKFVNPSTGERMSSGRYIATVLNHRTNEATVTVRPPTSGVHWELIVQGTTEPNSSELIGFVSYQLRSKPSAGLGPFPHGFDGFYGLLRWPERCGFSSHLKSRQAFCLKGCSGELQLLLPAQQTVYASALLHFAGDSEPQKHSVLLEMCEQALKVSVRMHRRGFYRLTLFCKDVGSDSSSIPEFANFLIECSSPMEQHRPFPEFLTRSLTERVSLDCPRDGELPANSVVHFRLSSPSLHVMMALHQSQTVHRKTGSVFNFSVITGEPGGELKLFGARVEDEAKLFCLYKFKIA